MVRLVHVLPIDDPAESARYSYSTTIGVTKGTESVLFKGSGYDQSLSIKLQNNPTDPVANHPDLRPAFFANKAFAIDITYPAYSATDNASGGYQQMYEVDLNTPELWVQGRVCWKRTDCEHRSWLSDWGSHRLLSLRTLSFNYGSLIGTGSGQIQTTDSYVELIMATNGDATHDLFYFDNARFFTPGDMNDDGHVNASDITAMESALTNPSAYDTLHGFADSDRRVVGDVNGDGVFDNGDLQSLLNYALNWPRYDNHVCRNQLRSFCWA